jgi:hypothetical protein
MLRFFENMPRRGTQILIEKDTPSKQQHKRLMIQQQQQQQQREAEAEELQDHLINLATDTLSCILFILFLGALFILLYLTFKRKRRIDRNKLAQDENAYLYENLRRDTSVLMMDAYPRDLAMPKPVPALLPPILLYDGRRQAAAISLKKSSVSPHKAPPGKP